MNSRRSEGRIIRATPEHIQWLGPLFVEYRRFYGFAPDIDVANEYLLERMRRNESVVLMALSENDNIQKALGFTQLYPSFSSLWMKRIWILYDLFVEPSARNQGVATKLMKAARDLAEETEAKTIVLETGVNNEPAQSLYEGLGYRRDERFYRYALHL